MARAEREVAHERHIASLERKKWGEEVAECFVYANDVLDEWEEESRAGAARTSPVTYTAKTAAVKAAPPERKFEVECGRWVYERTWMEVDARDAEEAAERALEAGPVEGWERADGAGPRFVVGVKQPDEEATMRTRLRIEERYGVTRSLEEALARRRAESREEVRTREGRDREDG